jgi:hypothetical protein
LAGSSVAGEARAAPPSGRYIALRAVSVVAPPDTPPEVQRPFDRGTEPSTPRVAKYRAWIRGKQLGQLGFTLTALVVGTAIGVAAGQDPWRPIAPLLAPLAAFTVAWTVVEALMGGRKLRWQVESAWPLPDGARETSPDATRMLLAPLLGGLILGALAGVGMLVLGDEASQALVPVLGGIGAGRILGLEIRLRVLVERAHGDRTYFVSLEDDEETEPLFWRFAGA